MIPEKCSVLYASHSSAKTKTELFPCVLPACELCSPGQSPPSSRVRPFAEWAPLPATPTPSLCLQRASRALWESLERHRIGFRDLGFFSGFIEIQSAYHVNHHFKVYKPVVFGTITELCNHHHHLIPEHLHHPTEKPHCHPPPRPLSMTNLLSISVDLPLLDIFC